MILTAPQSLLPLISRLRAIFAAQAREVRMRLPEAIRTGREIDLRHWDEPMATWLRPTMAGYWNTGLQTGKRQVSQALVRQLRSGKGLRAGAHKCAPGIVRKDSRITFRDERAFSLFNPSVIDAIDQATMLFCSTTNSTATVDLNEAIARLRGELREGIEAGEAYTDLGKRVQTLFSDPNRANLIATTETVRALSGGSVIAYQKSGVVSRVGWSTTTEPCPICLPLDGEEREFGEPFVILSKGPAVYRTVMHPPAHPRCLCATVPVL